MALTQSKKEERLGSSKYMNCGSLAIIIRYKNARDMKEWAKSHNIKLLEISTNKTIFFIIFFKNTFYNFEFNKIKKWIQKNPFFIHYSTVTDLAKFLGLSTSQPLFLAT